MKETSKKNNTEILNKTNQMKNRLQNSLSKILKKSHATVLGVNKPSSPMLETGMQTLSFSATQLQPLAHM